jgi:hypothetical protein
MNCRKTTYRRRLVIIYPEVNKNRTNSGCYLSKYSDIDRYFHINYNMRIDRIIVKTRIYEFRQPLSGRRGELYVTTLTPGYSRSSNGLLL